ncbi:hypothetical protein WSK_3968 [Novosphingobium sp. Rr 2-17]|uniref:hypothetical protein n=1 Tax=Novosphingobium sp. Rr 2-17 TaxID=555793 RepID=UPI0002699587|nr:hypothetical protein [Novosphingobium sp. Rr 2-17]EIZ77436.1 hypothetical protein WSK_3968 [Novosphingobium sp. Rr 2-17]
MIHDVAAEIVQLGLEAGSDLASGHIHRRWGWKGCLVFTVATIGVLALILLLVLWSIGVFD